MACSSSFADTNQIAASGAVTNAIAFGVQAGQIAGAAQACGLDVSVFTVRVSEAINKLALNPTDKMAATDSFQKTLGQAQAMQSANHPIACSQVTQDFNSLPILRSDYEQTVISQLNPGMTNNNNSAQTNTTTNQNQQTNNPANQNQQTNTANQQQQTNTNDPQQQQQSNATNSNNAANNNPAYGSSNNNEYGAYTPTRNNYDNAINSLNTTNQQSLNQPQQSSGSSSQSSNTNTQQNTANTQTNTTNTNNPPPPSFTNPNSTAPATTGGY